MDAAELIKQIELVKIEPGDLLVVALKDDVSGDDAQEYVESAMQSFEHALDHIGMADKVAVVFHNGNVELQHIRFKPCDGPCEGSGGYCCGGEGVVVPDVG